MARATLPPRGCARLHRRMKAMVLAAGLGTRLKPITFEIPKPMVPVLDRPVMAHIVDLLNGQGFDDLIANLHYFPNSIKNYFGDSLTYRFEEELLGTAGGVRNVADFFGDDPIVVISGDDGRIQGFQEKPEPAEALSNLGNCGIYVFSPEIFDYFPDRPFADWAEDVFPALLENDVPFYVHEIDEYWNDVGSLHELKSGTFDVLEGKLKLERSGTQ